MQRKLAQVLTICSVIMQLVWFTQSILYTTQSCHSTLIFTIFVATYQNIQSEETVEVSDCAMDNYIPYPVLDESEANNFKAERCSNSRVYMWWPRNRSTTHSKECKYYNRLVCIMLLIFYIFWISSEKLFFTPKAHFLTLTIKICRNSIKW